MTTSPDKGPVVLVYGCSECNWIYRALTPEEAPQVSWYAQVAFEKHDCSANQSGKPLHKKACLSGARVRMRYVAFLMKSSAPRK
jgi:hypothetical protein